MSFPYNRPRRLRQSPAIRQMVAEIKLSPDDFILPLFIIEGSQQQEAISSMPGYFRKSLDITLEEIGHLSGLGLRSVLLFVKVSDEKKDNTGAEALNPEGLMQRAVRAIKSAFPGICIMTDVALDPYSSYGHDGIVENGEIVNDPTIRVLAQMALSHARAGADFVAPSDMMDGRIGAIRGLLEKEGFPHTGILSYSAKFASGFYGPFRDALDSAPGFGDKKTYQMDYANSRESLTEVLSDIEEGADIVMVKPALPYLDIIQRVRQQVSVPIAAYQVSGEYAMIKAAAERGWVNEKDAIFETLTAIKRSGADLIATYFAPQILSFLKHS
ncbi:MAG: porphobilinogen synthase [Bacteroidia bacterium]|nr:porphobilinogen synthase [Bacteroidia bacterium]